MTIEQFIEKAIAGGWYNTHGLPVSTIDDILLKRSRERWSQAGSVPSTDMENLSFSAGYGEGQRHVFMFLDPEAWMAVARVEGWEDLTGRNFDRYETRRNLPDRSECTAYLETWRYNMHGMIDALADGKSIKQYLETI